MTTKTEHAADLARADAKAEHAAPPAPTGTKIFRSEEDVNRAGGSREVMQYVNTADGTVTQVDATAKRYRKAKGAPAVGNLPRDPFGDWIDGTPPA